MDILVLIGKRKDRYSGEYAPEALEVIDANGHSENPDFMEEKEDEYRASNEFEALEVVRVLLPDASVMKALYPTPQSIVGVIAENK